MQARNFKIAFDAAESEDIPKLLVGVVQCKPYLKIDN